MKAPLPRTSVMFALGLTVSGVRMSVDEAIAIDQAWIKVRAVADEEQVAAARVWVDEVYRAEQELSPRLPRRQRRRSEIVEDAFSILIAGGDLREPTNPPEATDAR